MAANSFPQRAFIALIFGAGLLLALVIEPFVKVFIFAMVLAGMFFPLHQWLTRKLRNRAPLSAAVLCLGLVVLLLLPIGLLSGVILSETLKGASFVFATFQSDGMAGLIKELPESLQHFARQFLSTFPVDRIQMGAELERRTSEHGGEIAGFLSAVIARAGAFVLGTVMMLISLYFLLLDGQRLIAWIESNSPLRKGQAHELLVEFHKVSSAVLVSAVVTAFVQAFAALIGFFLTRVPHPFSFALLTFVMAFVPAIGAASVCMLAALLLLALGHHWLALCLVLWGFIIVGLIDNLIKPVLVKRGMHLHGAIVFFSLLGGLSAFGPVGLLLGPMLVTFFVTLVRIYARDFRPAPPVPSALSEATI